MNLEDTTDLRKMLTKALARRKNILTYMRHVAPRDPNRERVEKTLAKHAIELDVLDAHIKSMQAEMKAMKSALSDKGVHFTLKEVKPVEPRKPKVKGNELANGKVSFDNAANAQAFIADLKRRGYLFHGKRGASPVVRNSPFHGVQWCTTPEGKFFFYTNSERVFRCYSIES